MITLSSSLFWLSVILFVYMVSYYAERQNSKSLVILIWIVLAFIAGFRAFNVGSDTYTYTRIICDPFYQSRDLEILFVLINQIVYGLTKSFSAVFFVYALLTYGLIIFRMWEMKKDISFSVSLITFFALCYFESLNVMRQYIAISIVFFATRYLYKGKYITYVLFVALAFSFHKSALLGLLCFVSEFLCWKNISKKKRCFLCTMICFGAFAVPFCIKAIGSYSRYFKNTFENVGYKVLELTVIFIISLFYIYKRSERKPMADNRERYLLRSTQIYYLMAAGLWMIGYYYQFMERISWYFLPFIGVYFGLLMKERKIYFMVSLVLKGVITLFIMYTLFNYLFLNNGPMHHPYHFVWSV